MIQFELKYTILEFKEGASTVCIAARFTIENINFFVDVIEILILNHSIFRACVLGCIQDNITVM